MVASVQSLVDDRHRLLVLRESPSATTDLPAEEGADEDDPEDVALGNRLASLLLDDLPDAPRGHPASEWIADVELAEPVDADRINDDGEELDGSTVLERTAAIVNPVRAAGLEPGRSALVVL